MGIALNRKDEKRLHVNVTLETFRAELCVLASCCWNSSQRLSCCFWWTNWLNVRFFQLYLFDLVQLASVMTMSAFFLSYFVRHNGASRKRADQILQLTQLTIRSRSFLQEALADLKFWFLCLWEYPKLVLYFFQASWPWLTWVVHFFVCENMPNGLVCFVQQPWRS